MRFDAATGDIETVKRLPTQQEIDTFMALGQKYTHVTLVDAIERGPLGMCFDWTMVQCIKLGESFRYVEGIARFPEDDGWILHAWLTDGKNAYDPTWLRYDNKRQREVVKAKDRYIGIEIPLVKVLMFVRRTGRQGVIANADRWPEMVDTIIADAVKAKQGTHHG